MEAEKNVLYEFLTAALSGNEEIAKTILALNKELPKSSIFAAAVLGEVDIVQEMLMQDPSLATKLGGPENKEPLLYLSFSCFLKNPKYNEQFVQTAKLLLKQALTLTLIFCKKMIQMNASLVPYMGY